MGTYHDHADVCMCLQQMGWVWTALGGLAVLFLVATLSFFVGTYVAKRMHEHFEMVVAKRMDAAEAQPVAMPAAIVPVAPRMGARRFGV